jgi:hypothetical protein
MKAGDRINNVDGSTGRYVFESKGFIFVKVNGITTTWNPEDVRFSLRQTITNICEKVENWIINKMPDVIDKFTVRALFVIGVYLLGMLTYIILK